ncbi:MAG TPA: DUF5710 domain-containing protein [Oligoflexia bacterium]|nr:DUF5710 domain-containing protein [Oligoflexia bacterium]HMP49373.1 DUF5710 domain-containing protein [Oligoflexia bacterium]
MRRVKVYLEVPFTEKNEAKSLGAWWDPGVRKWFVPEGVDISGFEKWIQGENNQADNSSPDSIPRAIFEP